MNNTRYTIVNQDRDQVHSCTNPEDIIIRPKLAPDRSYIIAVNVYMNDLLVGSFDSFVEAAAFLENNMSESES